ncbi:non-ribosomal peptide synthase protein (TIGR01720 family)/amino acid adenylation domain-containing protein [Alteromonadaceae bacterium 2753L.S.0a.02]|nr:non-ribosomal peptide synthase protein (TIGR01720 family)/amino acid adenylation domain-containing protein [Alteromonadaceae bacterium 2753L.S.0a.02]
MNDIILSNPLCDIGAKISTASDRQQLACPELFNEKPVPFCLATWHSLLHALTAKEEVILTCIEIFEHLSVSKLTGLVSELAKNSTFEQLHSAITTQYNAILQGLSNSVEEHNLQDHSAIHSIYILGEHNQETLDLSKVEIALIYGSEGWTLNYASAIYSQSYIEKIISVWKRIAEQVSLSPNTAISVLNLTDSTLNERAEMDGPVSSVNGNLVSRFLGISKAFPNKIALKDEHNTLSFAELDKLSDHYAALLVDAGIELGDCVGVAFNRNVKMVIGQYAVLKSGAVFVPMDAQQPAERLMSIADDAGIKFILTEERCSALLKNALSHVKLIEFNTVNIEPSNLCKVEHDVATRIGQNDIAYVIFTSGSTGRPKGVRVSHGNLLNFIEHIDAFLQTIEVGMQFAPFTFDASVAEIHVTLLHGGTLLVLPKSLIDDPQSLQNYMRAERVTFAGLPPQYAKHLEPEHLPDLRVLLTAGSAPDRQLIARWQPHVRYLNAYGPTETTILSTAWEANRVPDEREPIAMGLPILNTSIRVVNRFGQILPEGIVGELLIGGAGVAHGYIKQKKLSARNFVEIDNKRWYKSGDLSCFNAKEGLVFVGRLDDQIKLRGHRLEPGEIETAIKTINFVESAAAVASKIDGEYQLAVFCQGCRKDETIMRNVLSEVIPVWAMPNRIYWLDALPTTVNGKTDYERLKIQLKQFEELNQKKCAEPKEFETILEEELAKIWRKVLKAGALGRDANFIHLGGDSLTSMVVASSLRHLGFNISSAHLLSRPVFSDFCEWLETQPRTGAHDYRIWQGSAVLHPIQAWFFNLSLSQPNAFCQSLVFESSTPLDSARLARALYRLAAYHDNLRAKFSDTENTELWHLRQVIEAPGSQLYDIVERTCDVSKLDEQTENLRLALTSELDITQVPLFRMGILHSNHGSRVVWVLHHLLTDTISHSILLEDLCLLYEADSEPEKTLVGKSGAYPDWAELLQKHINTNAPQLLKKWQPVLDASKRAQNLNRLNNKAVNQGISCHHVQFSNELTRKLLREATSCYNQSAEELVLAASYLALAQVFDIHDIGIDIEWYGRDEHFAGDLSLTRSVGWFTCVHPLFFSVNTLSDLSEFLVALKEQRAKIPARGRDFYGLRYLCANSQVVDAFKNYQQPEVLFNFSGVTDRIQNEWRILPITAIEMGSGDYNPYKLSIESAIQSGVLDIGLYICENLWNSELISELKLALNLFLERIVEHCCDVKNRRWTPSDFTLLCTGAEPLDQEEIDQIPLDAEAAFPLTDMQQTMLRHEQTYQVWMHYEFAERFNEPAFRAAVTQWVALHPCLRTCIKRWPGDKSAQIILSRYEPKVEVAQTLPENRQKTTRGFIDTERSKEVKVEGTPPYTLRVFHSGEPTFSLVLSIHHIIHDGWSIELLLASLYEIYSCQLNATVANTESPSPNLEVLVREQIQLRDDPSCNEYWSSIVWKEQYCRLPENYLLSQTSKGNSSEVALYLDVLPQELLGQLREAAQRVGVTLNTMLLTGYVLLLRYLGGANQVRCGVIQSGRSETIADVEKLTGCCVNTLPLIVDFDKSETLASIIAEVNNNLSQFRYAATFPLSKVVEYARTQVSDDIFECLFNIESSAYGNQNENRGYTLKGGYESTNYAFIFGLIEIPEKKPGDGVSIGLRIGFDTAKYTQEMIEQWVRIYNNILGHLIANDEQCWQEVQPLPQYEQSQVLAWNNTFTAYPSEICIAEHFKEAARKAGFKKALCFKDKSLSYAELDQLTDDLARVLANYGVGPEVIVALVAERSLEMVVGILAILKTGGAYVPIDPDYPMDRIAHIIEETCAPVVIYQNSQFADVLPKSCNVEKIFLDQCENLDTSNLAPVDSSQHNTRQLAYVLYTSGSTGKPKGVMVEQRSIVRLVKNTRDLKFSENDTLMITSAPGFDVTTYEIWSALLNGLPLVVVDKDTLLDPEQLAIQLRTHKVTFLWLVAPLYNQLIQEKPELFEGVKNLMIGGDALSPHHIRIAAHTTPEVQLINGYGPTENTSFSTYHFLSKDEGNVIPIGRPISQSTAYVVNPDGQLLPPGARGELYVGGDGVARGYFERDELTDEKFVDNRFDKHPGRLYRTGDLVSWRKDGLIDFHGRIDFQIKIRGFRVELGEIETALLRQGSVAQALVLLQENKQGAGAEKRLLAYVVLQEASNTDSSELRKALLAELPDYMVPDSIVVVAAMPLNANGKVDRSKLFELTENLQTNDYESPETAGEKILFEVWKDVLGHSDFGVTDSFFKVGGDSILAIKIVARALKKELSLTTRIVMEHRTIRDIVSFVRPQESGSLNTEFALVTLKDEDLARARLRIGNIENVYPATAMQESLVLYSQRGNDAGSYHTQVRIVLENISSDLLRQSWTILAQRHDVLRTAFYDLNQTTLMQVVAAKVEILWQEYSESDCQKLEKTPDELFEQHRLEEFNNEITPLWRLLLIRQDRKRAELSWTHHHALLDGWSISHLLSELLTIYESLSKGNLVDTDSRNYPQFIEYIGWLENQDFDTAKDYWRDKLKNVEGASRLYRGDNNFKQSEHKLKQDMLTANLAAEQTAALRNIAMRMEVTLSAIMRAAWGLVLSRYTGENRVMFGCAISGRPALLEAVESTAGLFINSVPCVVSFTPEMTLSDLLHDVMASQFRDEEFGYLPLVQIQHLADIQADDLLFESLLVVENFPLNSDAFGANNVHRPKIIDVHGTGTNNLPLNVVVYPGSELRIDLAYQRTMFSASEVEDLLQRLLNVLQQFTHNPNDKIAAYTLTTENEKRNILINWNNTDCTLPVGQSVYSLYAATVSDRSARDTALVCGDQQMSRLELHNEVCRLAYYLREVGIAEGECVAVTFEKDPAFIVAVLALLKIGAAYVPVAVDCPKTRREFIVKDAGIAYTLTQSHLLSELSVDFEHNLIAVDLCPSIDNKNLESESQLVSALSENTLAYVIYTSGTTGQPKGVKISHRNIINFCVWCKQINLVMPGMAITQFAPFTFDASAAEVFTALLNGAELHLLSDDLIRDYRKLIQYVHHNNISFSAFPPPYLEQMPVEDLPDGMTLLTAGSAPSPKLVQKLSSKLRYINGYGPTETTILSTAWEYNATQIAEGSLPIGKPIVNTQVYLLDQYQQLCPIGVVGEICIAGAGVCMGYLNRDDLNREYFIDDIQDPTKKMYRTGDLGRWLANGDIEFIGRRDNQIKIRGYRIELSEIETQLLSLADVVNAVVAVVGNDDSVGLSGEGDSEKRIFAWVVVDRSSHLSSESSFTANLKRALKETLPPYMIPQAIVIVENLPLTANGKVDIKALPRPDVARLRNTNYEAPTTLWEKRLVSLWAETLKVEPTSLGITCNFFEVGGHSLLATRLCSAIIEKHGIEIPIAAVFDQTTLAELAEYIQDLESNKLIATDQNQANAKTAVRARIPSLPRNSNTLPLSDAQRRLWFFAELGDSKAAYNMSGGIGLTGGLNIDSLKQSLSAIVQRHEVLRSNIKVIDGTPVQEFREQGHYPLAVYDLRNSKDDEDNLIQSHLREEQTITFDLATDSLIRGRLLILGDDRYVLINTLHHIVSDGWSMGVLVSEMSEVYAALVAGRQPNLKPLPIQYADYSLWQQQDDQQALQSSHLSYWREQLHDLPTLHSLPLDYLRPAKQTHAGSHYFEMIDAKLNAQLRKFCSEQRVTVFMALYACFSGLLSRYSGEQDIVVGTPTANREQPEVAGLIGFFANTLVLRADLHGDPSFKVMLANAKQVVSEAYLHQALPFEQLVDELQPERNQSYQPLFQIMISMISSDELNNFSMAGVDLYRLDNSARTTSKFDLTLTISEEDDQLGLLWNYATDLFCAERIRDMSAHFVAFLEQVINNANRALSDVNFLAAEEKQRILFEWNDTKKPFPNNLCVHELFEQQVQLTPDQIAARFKSDAISYNELNERANRLARYLCELGVQPGDRVGLLCQRSIEALVGVFGTLKAGAAFVPMDTRAPAERLSYLIEDAGTKVLLTQSSFLGTLSSSSANTIALDDINTTKTLQSFNHSNISRPRDFNPHYLTYVIYTSGSTGQPKGVGVDHRAVVNYIFHMHQKCGCDITAAIVSNPLSFDGIGTTFWQILKGVTLELLPEGDGELEALAANLSQSEQPLLFKVTPSHLTSLKSLVSEKSIKSQAHWVVSGGEGFPVELARYWQKLLPDARFVNHYGPTEATIGCCHYFVPNLNLSHAKKSDLLPIGRPMSNRKLYVLDAMQAPVPIGVIGELYIGGEGIARGYLNRDALTSEKFIQNPFADNSENEQRMYRTGDLARYLDDGNIEYIGRIDHQVKIRGFRIECGEIEHCLLQHPKLDKCAVIVHASEGQAPVLAAYVVAVNKELNDGEHQKLLDELHHYAAEKLPDYMIPSAFYVLDGLPLTSNGKLDRKALLAFDNKPNEVSAPMIRLTSTEKKLLPFWKQVLKRDDVDITDEFFQIGGHSLMAAELIGLIRQNLKWDVPLRALFDNPTLQGFSRHCEELDVVKLDIFSWLEDQDIAHRVFTYSDDESLVDDGQGNIEKLQKSTNIKVCIIDKAAEAKRSTIKSIVNSVKSAEIPQYIIFCGDPEKQLRVYEQQGFPGVVPHTIDVQAEVNAISQSYNNQLFLGQAIDSFAATPMQKTMLNWKQRQFKHAIPINGYYSDSELAQAFLQVQREQELLCSQFNVSNKSWCVFPPPGRALAKVVDLRFQTAGYQNSVREKLAEALIGFINEATLPYMAYWVRLSDTKQILYFLNDHLIADKTAIDVLGNRLEMYLSGKWHAMGRTYRDHVESIYEQIREDNIDSIKQKLEEICEIDRLKSTVKTTRKALSHNKSAAIRVVDLRFKSIENSPIEHAFSMFTKSVFTLLNIDIFCMTLNYHSRQQRGNKDYDQVGLYLDRIPLCVTAQSHVSEIDHVINFVSEFGISFSGIDDSQLLGKDSFMPEFGADILFNFLGEDSFEKIAAGVESKNISNLQDFYGILVEAYTVENVLYTRLVFRGSEKLEDKIKQIYEDNIVEFSRQNGSQEKGNEKQDDKTPKKSNTVSTPISKHNNSDEIPAIQVNDVKKNFGNFEAVRGVSFCVKRGTCFGILGPNGAGKTTLLGMMEGITTIGEGSIRLLGSDVQKHVAKVQDKIGVQLQHSNYFDFLNVEQLLLFFHQLRGGKRRDFSIDELLKMALLSDKKKSPVEKLSGGQKQRLSMVIAMLGNPEVLFLDEPTSALDPHSRRSIWDLIETMKQERNITIVLTTHHMEEAEKLCDELLIMHRGEVISQGAPAELVSSLNQYHDISLSLSNAKGLANEVKSWPEVLKSEYKSDEGTMNIQAKEVTAVIKNIADYCTNECIEILRFDVNRPSLEDVFMHLTNKAV